MSQSAGLQVDYHIRVIRNIQPCRVDLDVLSPDSKAKFPSSTVNAFGAYLQQTLDDGLASSMDGELSNNVPVILSSWLGLLATGKIEDGKNEGSFEGHIITAVSLTFFAGSDRTHFHILVPQRDQRGIVDEIPLISSTTRRYNKYPSHSRGMLHHNGWLQDYRR
jgi:hypothetical protein